MLLPNGSRLGSYEIVAGIGAGGMGEVYRARDSKLRRDVAIKVLPSIFATDPERLARFAREAQVLASLNHPHIAHVYGIEEAGDIRAFVMELVDGPTLADRIAQGPIPVDEAGAIARQMADALDAAHERGIVHRDLKPANIKLTADGTVKVLDFGLAKAVDSASSGVGVGHASHEQSPATMTSPAMTQHGVILGTAAYMSPEQARGKPVDRRADIWAFGVVLYEMLTGKTLFVGDTVSDTIAEVLKREIDLRVLPAGVPPSITRVLMRCLERDPKKRLRDIGDAAHDLDQALDSPTLAAPARSRVALFTTFAAAVILAAAAAAALTRMLTRTTPGTREVVRASYQLPVGLRMALQRPQVAISPDGRHIATLSGGFAQPSLAIRRVDQLEWSVLPATDGAVGVFFSPDSQFVGFWTTKAIKKVPVGGGSPATIHELDLPQNDGPEGVMWADDGNVYYSDSLSGIYAVPASGGPPRLVVKGVAMSPYVPRGSRALLYVRSEAVNAPSLHVILSSLDGGEEVDLGEGRTPSYLPDGILLILRGDTLFAAPLDLEAGRLTGDPVAVAQQIASIGAFAQYSVSDTGTLVYFPGTIAVTPPSTLRRVSRQGAATVLPGAVRHYSDPRLSPDGHRLAVHLTDQQDDIWLNDLSRGTLTRMSFGAAEDETPAWSPNGNWIAFSGACRGSPARRCVFKRPSDGSGEEQVLWEGDLHTHVTDWSPDGKTLILDAAHPVTRVDVYLLDASPQDARQQLRPYVASAFVEAAARVSPDGRWLAYASNESGRQEIYIQSFPTSGGKVQVSTDGGIQPVWSRDGRELFFRSNTELMVARLGAADRPSFETPTPLFRDSYLRPQSEGHTTYDVFPDGGFVFIESTERGGTVPSLIAVFNWLEELKTTFATARR